MARINSASMSAPATNEVENLVGLGIEEERVDGEVAAAHVFFRGTAVFDAVGMAAVGIADVGAEGGDFDGHGLFARRGSGG